MGRTNEPEHVDFERLAEWKPSAPSAPTRLEPAELERLHAIEAAALAVTSSMYRRGGTVSSPSLATFDLLKELDAAINSTQEEGAETIPPSGPTDEQITGGEWPGYRYIANPKKSRPWDVDGPT